MQHFINLKPLWAPGFEVTSIKRKEKKSAVPLKVHKSHGHKIVPG